MYFFQRAFCYIRGKKGKSMLLFTCLFIISTMILCAVIVLQTAQTTSQVLREKTGAKLILEQSQSVNSISSEVTARISSLNDVHKINRVARGMAYPSIFSPYTYIDAEEADNQMIALHAYDNTEIDGMFAEEIYHLLEGRPITEHQGGIIVNSLFAEYNGLAIGDMLTFTTKAGTSASGRIVGIFFSGMERRQENSVMAIYRIENQVFVDHDIFAALFGTKGYSSLSVYTSDPEKLPALHQQIKQSIDDNINIITSDALYQQMQAPLKQIIRITLLILILITMTAVIVITLLLCMWMRTRKKEQAIFISLGISKLDLFLQAMTESISLFFLSTISAVLCSKLFLEKMINSLFTENKLMNIHLEYQHLLILIFIGGAVVLLSVGISILPTLCTNPMRTFERMED